MFGPLVSAVFDTVDRVLPLEKFFSPTASVPPIPCVSTYSLGCPLDVGVCLGSVLGCLLLPVNTISQKGNGA